MIYTFPPLLKSTIWGGTRIAEFKNTPSPRSDIGESWEISGVDGNLSVVADGPDAGMTLADLIGRDGASLLGKETFSRYGTTFPLLVKLIDAGRDLSVQVHPDDAMARRLHGGKGKTEMWFVVDSRPGARLVAGLRHAMTPAALTAAALDGSIEDCLTAYDVKPGDAFFIPAGRVHAIGAGCFVAEIQQTSDITYRLYDYNRTDSHGNRRELHLDRAREAVDYADTASARALYQAAPGSVATVVECDKFTVAVAHPGPAPLTLPAADSFTIVMALGPVTVSAGGRQRTLSPGTTALVAASAGPVTLAGPGRALLARP